MNSFTLLLLHLLLPVADGVFECVAGRWGPQCTKICGHCEGGPEFCQVYDGYCMNGCARGYKGTYCKDRCPLGTRGQYCKYKCGNCIGSTNCNVETGKCESGCAKGYQAPYCLMPCELDKWGDGCSSECKCQNSGTPKSCGCDSQNGKCSACGIDRYFPVKKSECLNEHLLAGVGEYVPPNVLDIPYKPILAAMGTVALFVLGNFIWWWLVIRNPAPKEEPVIVQREKKIPHHLRKKIKYKSTLADILRQKLAILQPAAVSTPNTSVPVSRRQSVGPRKESFGSRKESVGPRKESVVN